MHINSQYIPITANAWYGDDMITLMSEFSGNLMLSCILSYPMLNSILSSIVHIVLPTGNIARMPKVWLKAYWVLRCNTTHNLHLVSSPLIVTLTVITTDAGLLSCNCTAGGSVKLSSSLAHKLFFDTLGTVYLLSVKATSINPRVTDKQT